jgi:LysR family hydrogen peroxide-inducible transcriptional activator
MTIIHEPTLKQLRYLAALHGAGHFGRAAAASNVTQSTMSAAIAELESLLGAVLVERTKRRVLFTALGEAVVAEARAVLNGAQDIMRLVQAAQAPLGGPLRLGVIPTISPFLLPRVMPDLRRDYPKLQLYLTEDLTDGLLARLDAGDLDLLLLALPYDCGAAETTILFEDRFFVVCRRTDPLAASRRLSPARLPAHSLLLLDDGHCMRDHALAASALAAPHPRGLFAATSLFTLIQMVANGLGITLAPRLALDAGILKGTGLAVRPLRGAGLHRDIGLAWRRGTRRREEFETLGRAIAKHGASGGG